MEELEKYYPIAVSEISLYNAGSLLRFPCKVYQVHRLEEEAWLWLANKTAIYIDQQMLERNDELIKKLFSQELKRMFEELQLLNSMDVKGFNVTLYGQTILVDEDIGLIHFHAHYFLPQTFQSELSKRAYKPTKRLLVNRVTEQQAKDFQQRKERITKLFRGTMDE